MAISIIKIQNVKSLKQSIDYILQEHKTREDLISCYGCDRYTILDEFQDIYDERKVKWNRETKNKAKMLIQSFKNSDEVDPQLAHQIGKEYAENYLEGKHQYVIATHIDSEHIHNHIIFNQVETDTLKMFDTKRANTITKLHQVNDNLSKKYKLTIPEKRQRKNGSNYMSQREVEARKRGRSFKAELEEEIDRAIEKSNSYDEFLKIMKSNGYGITDGIFLWIEHKESKRLMSTKPLGIHYRKLSIKYRIENKDFEIVKNPYTIKNKHIDKSEEKYRENKGLRRWAAKNNIMHLLEISNLIINKKMSMEDIEKITLTEEEFYKSLEKSHSDITHKIDELEKRRDAFDVYKKYAWMIRDYKESDNPNEFKRAHFKQFKEWDKAKLDMRKLKEKYGITSKEKLEDYLRGLKIDLSENYSLYSHKNESSSKEKEIEKRRRR